VNDRVRTLLRPLASAVRRAGARRLARGAGRPDGDGARVCYGLGHLPGPDEVTGGGIVKLQALQRAFPDSPDRFNLLYLVSSRLPEASSTLVRSARRQGAKVVVNQNGVAYPAWAGAAWRDLNQPMIELLAQADYVIYQSAFCKLSADRFLGPPQSRWELLYNPVDTSSFVPNPHRSRVGGRLTLLLGGTQDLEYKIVAAFDVVRRLREMGRDARLLVTGRLRWTVDESSNRRSADRWLAERGLADAVTFVGPYAQRDAPGIFQQADVLLHTKYNDPSPTVIAEAMACGLPIVYSASGGVPEIVGDNAGIGIPAPLDWDREHIDAHAMAEAVARVADRPEPYREAARRRAVDCFDARQWSARHAQIFSAVLQ
jgi:glycosyltransferase involved in cell wall biosynthesis